MGCSENFSVMSKSTTVTEDDEYDKDKEVKSDKSQSTGYERFFYLRIKYI